METKSSTDLKELRLITLEKLQNIAFSIAESRINFIVVKPYSNDRTLVSFTNLHSKTPARNQKEIMFLGIAKKLIGDLNIDTNNKFDIESIKDNAALFNAITKHLIKEEKITINTIIEDSDRVDSLIKDLYENARNIYYSSNKVKGALDDEYKLLFNSYAQLKQFYDSLNEIEPGSPSYVSMFKQAINDTKNSKEPFTGANNYKEYQNLEEFLPNFFNYVFYPAHHIYNTDGDVEVEVEQLEQYSLQEFIRYFEEIVDDATLLNNSAFFHACTDNFNNQRIKLQQSTNTHKRLSCPNLTVQTTEVKNTSNIIGASAHTNKGSKEFNEDNAAMAFIPSVANDFSSLTDAMPQALLAMSATLKNFKFAAGTGACIDVAAFNLATNEVTVSKIGDTLTLKIGFLKNAVKIERLSIVQHCNDVFENKTLNVLGAICDGNEVTLDPTITRNRVNVKTNFMKPSSHLQGFKDLEVPAVAARPITFKHKIALDTYGDVCITCISDGILEFMTENQLAEALSFLTLRTAKMPADYSKNQQIAMLTLQNEFQLNSNLSNLSYFICEIARIYGFNDNLVATSLHIETAKKHYGEEGVVVIASIDAHGPHEDVMHNGQKKTDGELFAQEVKNRIETVLPLFISENTPFPQDLPAYTYVNPKQIEPKNEPTLHNNNNNLKRNYDPVTKNFTLSFDDCYIQSCVCTINQESIEITISFNNSKDEFKSAAANFYDLPNYIDQSQGEILITNDDKKFGCSIIAPESYKNNQEFKELLDNAMPGFANQLFILNNNLSSNNNHSSSYNNKRITNNQREINFDSSTKSNQIQKFEHKFNLVPKNNKIIKCECTYNNEGVAIDMLVDKINFTKQDAEYCNRMQDFLNGKSQSFECYLDVVKSTSVTIQNDKCHIFIPAKCIAKTNISIFYERLEKYLQNAQKIFPAEIKVGDTLAKLTKAANSPTTSSTKLSEAQYKSEFMNFANDIGPQLFGIMEASYSKTKSESATAMEISSSKTKSETTTAMETSSSKTKSESATAMETSSSKAKSETATAMEISSSKTKSETTTAMETSSSKAKSETATAMETSSSKAKSETASTKQILFFAPQSTPHVSTRVSYTKKETKLLEQFSKLGLTTLDSSSQTRIVESKLNKEVLNKLTNVKKATKEEIDVFVNKATKGFKKENIELIKNAFSKNLEQKPEATFEKNLAQEIEIMDLNEFADFEEFPEEDIKSESDIIEDLKSIEADISSEEFKEFALKLRAKAMRILDVSKKEFNMLNKEDRKFILELLNDEHYDLALYTLTRKIIIQLASDEFSKQKVCSMDEVQEIKEKIEDYKDRIEQNERTQTSIIETEKQKEQTLSIVKEEIAKSKSQAEKEVDEDITDIVTSEVSSGESVPITVNQESIGPKLGNMY